MSIDELLRQAAAALQDCSDSPQLDAQVLLCHVLDKPRSYLFTWPDRALDEHSRQRFQALLEQRLAGIPVAHLTGSREFWSLPLRVSADTLIPRPDTELLVAAILEAFPRAEGIELADLGTGSGAIALAIASERPGWRLVASDLSGTALRQARANARALGLDNIEFIAGRWCQPLADRRFDIIVSNPPYIAADDPHLSRGDLRFEPRSALVSGPEGLDDIHDICACARQHLKPGGLLMLEHGYQQQQAVQDIFTLYGFEQIRQYRDLASNPRATSGIYS